jgi:hypothetical protein
MGRDLRSRLLRPAARPDTAKRKPHPSRSEVPHIEQPERWPVLTYSAWSDTLDTVHRWTQIVGKIRLRQQPLINHWWNVTLYVTPHGLTTSMMPYAGERSFAITFDFLGHRLRIDDCDGEHAEFALEPMSVATFYRRTMDALRGMDITVRINPRPNEVAPRSTATRRIIPTMPPTSSVSGACCSRPTACATKRGHRSSAKRARCTSSGAASILR